MGHGKSVCARNVKRDAVCAVKCGARICDALEFYDWAVNSNSEVDFIWCPKSDMMKTDKEVKKWHKPRVDHIMQKHVLVVKDEELYSRETPCWKECCYSDETFLMNCEGWLKHEE